jgi:hypothetical protein
MHFLLRRQRTIYAALTGLLESAMRNQTGGTLPPRNLPPHWRHGHDSAAEVEAKHWAR